MDKAIARPPAWRVFGPYVLGGILILGICIWLIAASSGRAYRVAADNLTIGTVRRAPFEDFIAVRATAAPFSTQYLTTERGGVVKQVLVDDGATVKVGQPLIVLSNAALELEVASREADAASQINALQETKLQLEERRFRYEHDLLDIEHEISKLTANLARDKILLDGNAIAPSTYEQEEKDYAYQLQRKATTIAARDTEQNVRREQVGQIEEALTRLKTSIVTARMSLAALTIRAASEGRLTALDAEVGHSKAEGAILGQIDSLDRFKLTAQVDEFYLGRVELEQTAVFTLEGHRCEASISKIYPQVANGTFKVDLHFTQCAPQGIRTGQAIDIRLQLGGATTATMLPNGPFYQDTGGQWVFVVAPDGKYATRRAVRLGRRNPQYVEVLEGLQPGEKVITSSYQALQKFDRVEFEKQSAK